jgi:uncharacterized membrane protein HdeD (DUF308 family)
MLVLPFGDWQVTALRGLAALAFGILTLIWPGLTLWALVLLFGAYALVEGVFALAHAFTNGPSARGRRKWLVAEGLFGIAAGIITFVWPAITALALLYLIAAWAIVTGAVEIATSIQLRTATRDWWLLLLAGIASIVFGVLLMVTPGAGALVITWLIGWYAVFFGAMLLALAWRLRRVETALRGPERGRVREAAV